MSVSEDHHRYAVEFEAADSAAYERTRDARWRRDGAAQHDPGDVYYEAYDDAQDETNADSFMQRRSLLILAALVVVGGAGLMASAVSWRGAPAPAEVAAPAPEPAVAALEAAPQAAPVIVAPTAPAEGEAENNTGAAEAVAPNIQAPNVQAPSVQAPSEQASVTPSPATESMATIEALPAPVAAAPIAPAAPVTALDPAPTRAEARAA